MQLPAEIMAQVTGQQVRILAVTGDKRLDVLPDAPTFKERGIDLTLSLWRGIATPKGTPPAVIARLERAFTAAGQSPEFREFTTKLGAAVEIRSAADFDAFIAREDVELGALMEQIGLKKQ
jgi:tripartite-type tricarboxylate transporter receptor subunit TctC